MFDFISKLKGKRQNKKLLVAVYIDSSSQRIEIVKHPDLDRDMRDIIQDTITRSFQVKRVA